MDVHMAWHGREEGVEKRHRCGVCSRLKFNYNDNVYVLFVFSFLTLILQHQAC